MLGARRPRRPAAHGLPPDLTEPEGLFAAREFVIRDEDTIYITEAPLGTWTRVLAIATAAAALVTTADRLGG